MYMINLPEPENCGECPFGHYCVSIFGDDCPVVEVSAPLMYKGEVIGYVNDEKYRAMILEAFGITANLE